MFEKDRIVKFLDNESCYEYSEFRSSFYQFAFYSNLIQVMKKNKHLNYCIFLLLISTCITHLVGQNISTILYDEPIILDGKTFVELKATDRLIDYVLYDYEPVFFSLRVDDGITEYYKYNDSSLVVRIMRNDGRLEQGLMRMNYYELIESDTSSIFDPISYESTFYIGLKRNLLKHGEWTEIDGLGRRCIGKYQDGIRIGEWKFLEKESTNSVEYKNGKIIGHYRPRIDTVSKNENWLLNENWYWCGNSKGAVERKDTSIYTTYWNLKSEAVNYCAKLGILHFKENNEFEFTGLNDDKRYLERKEGVGRWELMEDGNIVKLILVFNDGVKDEMIIDYFSINEIRLIRDGW